MSRRILLIDDLRDFRTVQPGTEVTIARTSREALNILTRDEVWDEIWFDHDLGEATGAIDSTLPVVDYLSERAFYDNPVQVGMVLVHTSNSAGRRDLLAALNRFGYPNRVVAPEVYFTVADTGIADA